MIDPLTRPSLLVRLRQHGDQNAWREFDAAYGDLIVRYSRRRGLQLADAEDVRQLVLAKLSHSLRNFSYDPNRGRFRHYLHRCVRNAVISFSARHKAAAPTVSLDETAVPGQDNAELDRTWEEEWIQHHYRRALRTLRATTDTRTLAVFEEILRGASPPALAERFDTTEANIRKIKQRMRERMEQAIRSQLADEEAHEDWPASPTTDDV